MSVFIRGVRRYGEGDPVDVLVADGIELVNRALHVHAVAAADPQGQQLAPERAVAVRIGYGDGEEVADSRFASAREVDVWASGAARRRRREEDLRPQERVAAVLGEREQMPVCEILLLRARADLDAEVVVSESAADAESLARKAADAGRDLIVAGGDGTVGLIAGVAAETGRMLAVVPTGAGNDFASTLGYDRKKPLDAIAAIAALVGGSGAALAAAQPHRERDQHGPAGGGDHGHRDQVVVEAPLHGLLERRRSLEVGAGDGTGMRAPTLDSGEPGLSVTANLRIAGCGIAPASVKVPSTQRKFDPEHRRRGREQGDRPAFRGDECVREREPDAVAVTIGVFGK